VFNVQARLQCQEAYYFSGLLVLFFGIIKVIYIDDSLDCFIVVLAVYFAL